MGEVYVEGNQPQAHVFPYQSAQAVELCAVLQVFQEVEQAFNLVLDSQYVVQAVQQLETVGVIKATSTVCTLLSSLQKMIWERKHPFCIVHVRAHSGLPGPIARGNSVADEYTRSLFVFMSAPPVQLAASCITHISGMCVTSVQYQNFSRAANLSRAIGVMLLHKDEGIASIDCCCEQHQCGDCNCKAMAEDHPGNCGIL